MNWDFGKTGGCYLISTKHHLAPLENPSRKSNARRGKSAVLLFRNALVSDTTGDGRKSNCVTLYVLGCSGRSDSSPLVRHRLPWKYSKHLLSFPMMRCQFLFPKLSGATGLRGVVAPQYSFQPKTFSPPTALLTSFTHPLSLFLMLPLFLLVLSRLCCNVRAIL